MVSSCRKVCFFYCRLASCINNMVMGTPQTAETLEAHYCNPGLPANDSHYKFFDVGMCKRTFYSSFPTLDYPQSSKICYKLLKISNGSFIMKGKGLWNPASLHEWLLAVAIISSKYKVRYGDQRILYCHICLGLSPADVAHMEHLLMWKPTFGNDFGISYVVGIRRQLLLNFTIPRCDVDLRRRKCSI